jgi:hypothetical protein
VSSGLPHFHSNHLLSCALRMLLTMNLYPFFMFLSPPPLLHAHTSKLHPATRLAQCGSNEFHKRGSVAHVQTSVQINGDMPTAHACAIGRRFSAQRSRTVTQACVAK